MEYRDSQNTDIKLIGTYEGRTDYRVKINCAVNSESLFDLIESWSDLRAASLESQRLVQ